MAAMQAPAAGWDLVDLRELRADELAPILKDQQVYWRTHFQWDFSTSAGVLRRFLNARTLHGHALVERGRPVGYSYFIYEEGKALIGDLYVLERWRDPDIEQSLLQRTLQSAALYPRVRRIEGQLLAASFEPRGGSVFRRPLRCFPRLYLLRRESRPAPMLRPEPDSYTVRRWSDDRMETAAELIAEAYVGHVDSEINDQYRSFSGARRFLANTTRHTGCGEFLANASLLAARPSSYRLDGLCLASRIDVDAGHITQLCVSPGRRRAGLGAALLRRSMAAQAELGLSAVSLTVTESNHQAVKLYERFGFTVQRRFPAFVWEAQ